MSEVLMAQLRALKKFTQSVLDAIPDHAVAGAVNWADLHCVEAGQYTTDDASTGFYVLIEEASPEAHELRQYVWNELEAAGFNHVDVRTEW